MIWKNLGIVAVLFLILGTFVYFYEVEGGKKREEAEEKAKKLFPFEKDAITAITLSRSNSTIALQKNDDMWNLVQPIEVKADKNTAESLASDFGSAKVERSLESNPIDWKAFGLERPGIKVMLTTKNNKTFNVDFGDKDFNDSSVFAKIPGQEKILILPSSLLTNTEKNLFDFRDKVVLNFDKDQVNELKILFKRKKYHLEKNGEDWSIQQPIKARADRSKVSSLLSDLDFARVEEFIEHKNTNSKNFGLKRPMAKVQLYLGENKAEKSLLIGKKVDSQYYAKDVTRKDVFKIKEDLVEKLNLDLITLRDKKMVHFERSEVKQISVKLPTNNFEFIRGSDDKWKLNKPEGHKEKSLLEYKLFWPLEDLEGKEIDDQINLNNPKYGFQDPSAEITIVKKDSQATTILLGGKEGDLIFGKTVSDPTLYKLDKKILEDLNFKIDDITEQNK